MLSKAVIACKLPLAAKSVLQRSLMVHSSSMFKLTQIQRPLVNAILCQGFKSIFKNKRTYVLKTVKGVHKRFRLTGNGLLKSKHSGKSHLARNKGRARIRRLAQTKTITGVYLKKMKSLILHGK